MTLVGPETGAFPDELALEPKEQCPQTACSVHVQQEPRAVSCAPLRVAHVPKQRSRSEESDPQGKCAALQLLHTQCLRGARVANWQSTS